MLAFELAGGREAGRAFIDALRIPELTASLGSVHTMVVHPPSTSHRQSSEAELLAAGITPGPAAGVRRARGRRGPRRPTSGDALAAARAAGRRPCRRSPPSREPAIATPAAVSAASHPTVRPEHPSPPRARVVAPADLGRLRRPPDHRAGPAGGRRDDPPAAAGLRVPLADRLRNGDGPDSTPATTRSLGPRVVDVLERLPRLPGVPLRLVQRRARRAGPLDRRVHARPDAAAVARRRRHPGRPARAVLRPARCRTGPR